MPDIICGYCHHYRHGKILTRKTGQPVIKRCAANKKILFESKTCKYFNPDESFFCDEYNCWLPFVICLGRRRMTRGGLRLKDSYAPCIKCRQFETQIQPIIEKYFIGSQTVREIKNPKKGPRKLKRRSLKSSSKRVLKRRSQSPAKRKLKRRNKK